MMWGETSFSLVTFAGLLVSSLNWINQVFLRILAVVSLPGRCSARGVGQLWPEKPMRGCCQDEFGQE